MTNDQLSLLVVPDLGGKIVSLDHHPSQRAWLWRNPRQPYRQPTYGDSYIQQFDLGGLDECFPSVAPIHFPRPPWAGALIPDHGELWAQPWETTVVENTTERVVLSLACHGVRLPYRFERRLTVEAGTATVRLNYAVSNLSPFPLPFVWSIHPILNIRPGMRLVLPPQVNQVRVDSATAAFMGKMGVLHPWPATKGPGGRPLDLSTIPPASAGWAAKLYSLPLQGAEPVEARIADPESDHYLGFRFRPSEITHLGLWMNYGGWAGDGAEPYFNLGFEPCIGGADALTVAEALNEYAILEARQTRRWTLELIVN